jgi:hypothetical protein
MNDSKEEIDKIYQEIIDLIWSIFPEDGIEAYFYAQIFKDSSQRTFYWLDKNGDEAWHDFENSPNEITLKIISKLELLQQHKLFEKERWTHCKVTVTDDYKLNIKFAYIPQDDSWPGLFMRGISELTLEEAKKYYIPEEEWEKHQEKTNV